MGRGLNDLLEPKVPAAAGLPADQRLMLVLGQISAWLYLGGCLAIGMAEHSFVIRDLALVAFGFAALSNLAYLSAQMRLALGFSMLSWVTGAAAGIGVLVIP